MIYEMGLMRVLAQEEVEGRTIEETVQRLPHGECHNVARSSYRIHPSPTASIHHLGHGAPNLQIMSHSAALSGALISTSVRAVVLDCLWTSSLEVIAVGFERQHCASPILNAFDIEGYDTAGYLATPLL